MYAEIERPKEEKSKAIVNSVAQRKGNRERNYSFGNDLRLSKNNIPKQLFSLHTETHANPNVLQLQLTDSEKRKAYIRERTKPTGTGFSDVDESHREGTGQDITDGMRLNKKTDGSQLYTNFKSKMGWPVGQTNPYLVNTKNHWFAISIKKDAQATSNDKPTGTLRIYNGGGRGTANGDGQKRNTRINIEIPANEKGARIIKSLVPDKGKQNKRQHLSSLTQTTAETTKLSTLEGAAAWYDRVEAAAEIETQYTDGSSDHEEKDKQYTVNCGANVVRFLKQIKDGGDLNNLSYDTTMIALMKTQASLEPIKDLIRSNLGDIRQNALITGLDTANPINDPLLPTATEHTLAVIRTRITAIEGLAKPKFNNHNQQRNALIDYNTKLMVGGLIQEAVINKNHGEGNDARWNRVMTAFVTAINAQLTTNPEATKFALLPEHKVRAGEMVHDIKLKLTALEEFTTNWSEKKSDNDAIEQAKLTAMSIKEYAQFTKLPWQAEVDQSLTMVWKKKLGKVSNNAGSVYAALRVLQEVNS